MEVAQAEAEKQLRDEHNMTLLDTLDEKRRTRQAEQVIHMHTCTLRAQSTDGLWREGAGYAFDVSFAMRRSKYAARTLDRNNLPPSHPAIPPPYPA